MTEVNRLLCLLQYGDSFFPSGAVSFSWGLEGLVHSGAIVGKADVEAFVIGQLRSRWANYERPVIAAAHAGAASLGTIEALDALVESTTTAAEVRNASRRMRSALLSVFARLGHEPAQSYRLRMAAQMAHGHQIVMQGMLWASAAVTGADAVVLSAHSLSTTLLSAGVRLGCITHIDAQQILAVARREAAVLAEMPMTPIEDISAGTIEAEIAIMHHAARDLRLFAN